MKEKRPIKAEERLSLLTPEGQRFIPLTYTSLAIIAIVAFAVFIRFYHLERMAYHHDESIHGYYSYQLYAKGPSQYTYDPTYHGPLQYHYMALMFMLFGDSDFTGRTFQTACGIFLLLLLYNLRRWIPPRALILAMLFIAISPTLSYFSRFARGEVPILFWNTIAIVFAYRYFQMRKPLDFILCWLGVILMYCEKTNSYFIHAIFGSFLVMYGVCRVLFTSGSERAQTLRKFFVEYSQFTKLLLLFGVWSAFQFVYVYIPIAAKVKEVPGDFPNSLVRSKWAEYHASHPAYFYSWWTLFALVVIGLFFLLWMLKRKYSQVPAVEEERKGLLSKEEGQEGAQSPIVRVLVENYLVIITLCMAVLIYGFLFSSMGANRRGWHDGLIDYLAYWIGQQKKPRIHGPWYYHLWRFVVYEPGMFFFALAAIVYYGGRLVKYFLAAFKEEDDEYMSWKNAAPPAFTLFIIYWLLASMTLYAKANEKVPWLMTHQAYPMCILAALFVHDILARPRWINPKPIMVALTVIVCVWALRTSMILNIRNNDDEREAIVYTQSSQDVKLVMEEIEKMARETGLRKNFKVACGGSGGTNEGVDWPFSWYLRNYSYQGSLWNTDIPVMITGHSQRAPVERIIRGEGVWRGYRGRLRAWWQPSDPTLRPGEVDNDKITTDELRRLLRFNWWSKFVKYFVYREPWSTVGSSDFMVYYRQDPPQIVRIGYETKIEERNPTPKATVSEPQPGELLTSWGSGGTATGQLDKPRGLKLGPDGNIYVTDSMNGRIQVFSPTGEFVRAIGRPRTGEQDAQGLSFSVDAAGKKTMGPCGVAVAPDGSVYVADTWGHRIIQFTSDGTHIRSWGSYGSGDDGMFLWGPRDIAVAANGNVYIADTGNARIRVYDSAGKPLRSFGDKGKQLGYLMEPVGIAIQGDRVYVADTGNKRIQIFNLEGLPQGEWPVTGWSPPDYVDQSTGETTPIYSAVEPYVAVDDEGNVYVTEYNENVVHQYSPDGQSVKIWGQGRGMRHPTGLDVDGEGNVYISDLDGNRILKFRRQS